MTLSQSSQEPVEQTLGAVDSAADNASLSNVVYVKLRTALMRAQLRPHQRLKVRELSRQMETSETPVREALFQLAHEGAIEIKPRYYIRVRRVTSQEYEDIRDIRLQLEPLAAERALPFLTEEDIAHLTEVHASLAEAEANGDWETALRANFDFHFGLYCKSDMATLVQVLEGLWIRIGPVLCELYPDASPQYAGRHQHEAVLTALRAGNAYALREAIRMDLIEGGRNLLDHLRAIEANK